MTAPSDNGLNRTQIRNRNATIPVIKMTAQSDNGLNRTQIRNRNATIPV